VSEVQGEGNVTMYRDVFMSYRVRKNLAVYIYVCLNYTFKLILHCTLVCVRYRVTEILLRTLICV